MVRSKSHKFMHLSQWITPPDSPASQSDRLTQHLHGKTAVKALEAEQLLLLLFSYVKPVSSDLLAFEDEPSLWYSFRDKEISR